MRYLLLGLMLAAGAARAQDCDFSIEVLPRAVTVRAGGKVTFKVVTRLTAGSDCVLQNAMFLWPETEPLMPKHYPDKSEIDWVNGRIWTQAGETRTLTVAVEDYAKNGTQTLLIGDAGNRHIVEAKLTVDNGPTGCPAGYHPDPQGFNRCLPDFGCSSGGPSAWSLLAAPLLLLRRRRRDGAQGAPRPGVRP